MPFAVTPCAAIACVYRRFTQLRSGDNDKANVCYGRKSGHWFVQFKLDRQQFGSILLQPFESECESVAQLPQFL